MRREVRRLGVTYPVVIDNNLTMWDALDNHAWPTTYLIDREGIIRHAHIGETHEGSREAIAFERILSALLKAAPSSGAD